MTRNDAIEAMQAGQKVRHMYFTDEEWITMEHNLIVTEEGYKFPAYQFWDGRTGDSWETGWEVV